MTAMQSIFCDLCGSGPITEDRTLIRIESGPLYLQGRRTIDACKDCLPRLAAVLARPVEARQSHVFTD